MNAIIRYPIALSLILGTVGYSNFSFISQSTLAQQTNPPKAAQIIKTKGEAVLLKRQTMQNYESLTINNTVVNLGDLLRVKKGQTVVIQCEADKTTWTVPDDDLPWGVANVCSPPRTRRNSINQPIS